MTKNKSKKENKPNLSDLVGILKYNGPSVSVEDMNKAIIEAVVEKYKRKLKK